MVTCYDSNVSNYFILIFYSYIFLIPHQFVVGSIFEMYEGRTRKDFSNFEKLIICVPLEKRFKHFQKLGCCYSSDSISTRVEVPKVEIKTSKGVV